MVTSNIAIKKYIDQTDCMSRWNIILHSIKYVDVKRQTRTGIDNASEHTLSDHWTAESEVLLSEEWIGTHVFNF